MPERFKKFLIPSLIFIIFLVLYLILLQTGEVKYYSLERMLTQWDAQHYLSIARDGYQKFPCSYDQNYICGNIGWFPMYPVAASVLSFSDSLVNGTMLFISWLSLLLAMIILYSMVSEKYGRKAGGITLLSMVLFPSSFYFLTAFPYSFYLLSALTVFYMLEKQKYLFLFIPVMVLTLTYPSGVVIVLPLLYHLIKKYKTIKISDRLKLIISIISSAAALILYGFYYLYRFGDFFLYQKFQSQSYYAHDISFPLVVVFKALTSLTPSNPVWIVFVLVTLLLVIFLNKKTDTSWMLFMFGILLFTPTFGTSDCYYRHIVAAFPLYVMIGTAINDNKRKYIIPVYFIISIILTLLVFLPAYRQGLLM